jgi:hypothetical protein
VREIAHKHFLYLGCPQAFLATCAFKWAEPYDPIIEARGEDVLADYRSEGFVTHLTFASSYVTSAAYDSNADYEVYHLVL